MSGRVPGAWASTAPPTPSGEAAVKGAERPMPGTARSGGGEAGFTMVLLVVIVAVMSILLTVAIQLASFQMQREKEAELIFRGEQYVEAIRLYRMRYGRYPMTLKEIWEADPKVIRKKWKDPITDSESWGLVFLGQEGERIRPGVPGLPTPSPSPTPEAAPEETSETGASAGEGGQQTVGPIIGVRSTSCDPSIKVYQGRERYCDWKFIFREQPQRPPHP